MSVACTCPSGDGSLRWPCPTHPPVTAVDRPDNGQDEGSWRVGSHYGIHVYVDDRPVGTFLRSEDAARAVTAVNAGRAGAGEQQRERVARWLFDQRMPARYWDNPSFELERDAARQMADELLALLGGPQSDGEARQHRMDADCWCGSVQADNGAWDHQ